MLGSGQEGTLPLVRMGNWDLENFARYPTARLLGSGSIRGFYLEVRVKALTGSKGISLG